MCPRSVVSSQWWYALVGIFVVFFLTSYITIPDVTLLVFGLNVVLIVSIAACVVMDTRSIQRSDVDWNPSEIYAMGAIFTPILILYAIQRWRYVGVF